jgi:hypothetical protein
MCLGTGLDTWNVRSVCRSGFLTTGARELARYKLDLVGIQKVRWEKWDTARARDYVCVCIYIYIYIYIYIF